MLTGVYGTAQQLEIPDTPDAAESVCSWLITAPAYHPMWSQYVMSVVRLREGVPGYPEPYHKFPGTTHELLVVAIDPTNGPYTTDDIHEHFRNHSLPYLDPVNIAEQYIATDDEMHQLTYFLARGIVDGRVSPEAPLSPDTHRAEWLTMTTKTLAHIRGEEHAP